jgi:hypothetical protein
MPALVSTRHPLVCIQTFPQIGYLAELFSMTFLSWKAQSRSFREAIRWLALSLIVRSSLYRRMEDLDQDMINVIGCR